MRSFRSDNNAGICPEAMDAIVQANRGHQVGYGDDAFTRSAIAAFRRIFGGDAPVWFVATGTAANVLAIAALTEPWQQVICHRHSHYNDDESTAPERITHCRAASVDTLADKLTPEDILRIASGGRGDVHQPQAGILTVSNPTEFGTVYTPAEMKGLCETAHAKGYRVHVDGARFANAVASLRCDPRALTVEAGVDALSFGGTKNGLAFGEAVILFPQGDGRWFERGKSTIEFHRKGAAHLLSKHRFVSAPFAAVLQDGVWLRHAERANAMAGALAAGLRDVGVAPAFAVEANAVFVELPVSVHEALQSAGHGYYPFPHGDRTLYRLMCSFDTEEAEVRRFVTDAGGAMRR